MSHYSAWCNFDKKNESHNTDKRNELTKAPSQCTPYKKWMSYHSVFATQQSARLSKYPNPEATNFLIACQGSIFGVSR